MLLNKGLPSESCNLKAVWTEFSLREDILDGVHSYVLACDKQSIPAGELLEGFTTKSSLNNLAEQSSCMRSILFEGNFLFGVIVAAL